MSYCIFGKIENQFVTFVGCIRSAEIPTDSILLQMVEDHPEANWIKWVVRFRRTLTDAKALDHPLTRYFKNPSRLKRVLGDKDFTHLSADENERFLKFHQRNQQLLQELRQAALAEQAEGRNEYSVRQLLGDARWGDIDIDRGTDPVKISEKWSPWYSRVLQIIEPRLVGFFTVRPSIADGLVWTDGRTWQQFASENSEKVKWSDQFVELPDSDWEYRG